MTQVNIKNMVAVNFPVDFEPTTTLAEALTQTAQSMQTIYSSAEQTPINTIRLLFTCKGMDKQLTEFNVADGALSIKIDANKRAITGPIEDLAKITLAQVGIDAARMNHNSRFFGVLVKVKPTI